VNKKFNVNESLDIISTIHKQGMGEPEAYIGLLRKPTPEETPEMIGSFKPSELKSLFPQIVEHLLVDAYFTVNSYYMSDSMKESYKTDYGFQPLFRKEIFLRYLKACYVDLDVGRPGDKEKQKRRTANETLKRIADLEDQGKIPNVSMTAKSGQGVYAFWLLHDIESDTRSQRAWFEKIALYKQIHRELHKKFKGYAPDGKAIDAARYLRIPNTLHGKVKREAKYKITLDQYGQLFVYSLKELAEFLNIPITKSAIPKEIRLLNEPSFREIKEKGSAPNRIKGFQGISVKRIIDYRTIEQINGGWDQGYRRQKLLNFAYFFSLAGLPQADALRALEQSALNCNPPYPSDPTDQALRSIVRKAYTKPRMKNTATLLKLYQVTKEQAIEFELETIIPDDLRKEREAENKLKPTKTEQARLEREQALKRIIKEHGLYSIKLRRLETMFKEMGIKNCSRTTIGKDLKRMKIELLRASGRPKKEST